MILRLTLSLKFLMLTTSVLLISFAGLEIFFLNHQKDLLYSSLKNRYLSLAKSLATNCRYGLMIHNKEYISDLLRSLSEYEDVTFAWVEDGEGENLGHYGKIPDKQELKSLGFTTAFTQEDVRHNSNFSIQKSENLWLISATVSEHFPQNTDALILEGYREKEKRTYLGTICLGISLKHSKEALNAVTEKSLLVVAAVAVLSIMLTLFSVRLVTGPLKRLKIAADMVRNKTFPPKIEIRSKDEIGELASAFNRMTEQVITSQRKLEDMNERLEKMNQALEKRVEERTLTLKKTIRELIKAKDDLQAAYSEIKQMYNVKNAFLRSASHELRTPLTAIKANIDYLCQYELNEIGKDAQEAITSVGRNVNNMKRLVEEILDIVRLDSSQAPLEITTIDIGQIITECVEELNSLKGEINLVIDLEPNLKIKGDKTRLHDLFTNLISNSYKFTPPDGTVKISGREKDKGIFLEVSDTGEGIAEDHLPHIFEPFYQAHRARGGTGLGLAIVKGVVERHGGYIEVDSKPHKGTTFSIWLPSVDLDKQ